MEILSMIILFFSGIGAGVMTGLIGASAVTFMAGILVVLLGYNIYDAIGISLMTDVSASLVSTHLYKKAKNIDIKEGILIGVFATIFAFLGSFAARKISETMLGNAFSLVILFTGISFLRNPLKKEFRIAKYFTNKKILGSILIGIVVGLVCGIFGAGGGITILMALIFILKYPIKVAIGTSVLIMAFISLSGGIGHFISRDFPLMAIIITSIGAIIGAIIATKQVNRLPEEKIFKISGIILIMVSLLTIFKNFLF